MLTATIIVTAPDRESLVECIDFVTESVAAGHHSYQDPTEGDAQIRFALDEHPTGGAVPAAVDAAAVSDSTHACASEPLAGLLWDSNGGTLHAYTVTWTTHQYERWDQVLAPSKAALRKRLDDLGIEALGLSNKQDTTWADIDISREDDRTRGDL